MVLFLVPNRRLIAYIRPRQQQVRLGALRHNIMQRTVELWLFTDLPTSHGEVTATA